jgi:plastocyanin
MSRLSHRALVLVPAIGMIVLSACGGKKEEASNATGGENQPATTEAAKPAAPVANAATITGHVLFTGTAPANAKIDMSEEKVCADKHKDGATEETVVVKDGKLQNAFVYVKSGLTGPSGTKAEKVELDQDGCQYKPHVLGIQVGQNLVIKNADGILHNIKVKPTANRPFNISQPTTMESTRTFEVKEVMIPVECNVHGWMHAYIGVLDHPYFAVSGEDGTFKIGNLPPGTYAVEAWHEKYGTQTQNVTVGPNESKDVTFTYSAKAATAVPLGKPLVVSMNGHSHAGHSQ